MNENMYCYRYPHPAVTTDCVIFTWDEDELKVLLVRRGIDPYKGCWALPGGFLRMDETAEECAMRELKEETGLEAASVPADGKPGFGYLSQLGAFSGVGRDPRERVITIAYYALVKKDEVVGGDDADEARWMAIERLPELAFDHEMILNAAMARLREDMHFRPICFQLLPERFTMPQLQAIYQAVLGVNFDRRNFAKKMLSLGLLTPVAVEKADGEAPEADCDARPMPDKGAAPSEDGLLFKISNCLRLECSPKPEVRRSIGREPNWYVFNKEKYEDLKRRDVNRLEF